MTNSERRKRKINEIVNKCVGLSYLGHTARHTAREEENNTCECNRGQILRLTAAQFQRHLS